MRTRGMYQRGVTTIQLSCGLSQLGYVLAYCWWCGRFAEDHCFLRAQ